MSPRPTPTGPIPLLCHQCGEPARAPDGRTLRCPHCGAFDRLPARDLERALELKRRLQRAARAALQLDGLELRLATLYEDRRRFAATIVALALGALALGALALAELRIWPLAAGATWVGGLALAGGLALLVGRRHYRRAVRPHLAARPPLATELPPRCRACAGDLRPATARRPFARCRYCSTVSLATRPRAGTVTAGLPPATGALLRTLALTVAGSTAVMLALVVVSSLWRR